VSGGSITTIFQGGFSSMRKLLVVAVALLAVGAGVYVGPATGSGNTGVATGPLAAGTVRPWAVQHMGGSTSLTLSQAVADAQHFDVITAHEGTYRPYVAAMKLTNPSVRLFVYMNGTATYVGSLSESAYAHDAAGNRIRINGWSQTYLLDPSSPAAIAYQVDRASRLVAYSGYDGLYLDVLGTAPLDASYVTSLPVNPATGQVWTRSAWLDATTALATKVTGGLGGKPVIGNGLTSGSRYYDPSAPTSTILSSGINGAVPEAWLRGAWTSAAFYPSEAAWKQGVDMLTDAGARGDSVMTITKVWSNGTDAQKAAWYHFALASFLLGNDGKSFFFFSSKPGDSTVDRPESHINLGPALAAYAKIGGVYQRDFAGGKVLVNPTKSAVTVQVAGVYFDTDGSLITGSVTLPAFGAKILHV
jgi:hypothetical protein